jgi:hypothetical protein
LEQYYRDGYSEVRKFGDGPVVLLSEAYQSLGFWSGFMPQPQYNKVALDVVSRYRYVQHTWATSDHPDPSPQHIYGMCVKPEARCHRY